jgi:hypothetical protein
MVPVTAVFSAALLLLLLQLFSVAGAYYIDNSCKPYVKDGRDRTAMIEAAMIEAKAMIVNAAVSVIRDVPDDTRDRLFRGASITQQLSIACQSILAHTYVDVMN